VADSHPKDELSLGDTLPPTGTDPGLEPTHHSGETLDPTRGAGLSKGDTLDRYVVLEPLGQGGMGEVYAAWDPVLDRKVAVKIIRADHQNSSIADELRLRLMREAQALARTSHPNVVTVHDVGLVDGRVFLAMEFVDGRTLTNWLVDQPRTWREVLQIFIDAGYGLAAAHDAGVTHRDFKPDNVVVSTSGRARVMDFGLAHAHGEQQGAGPELLEDAGSSSIRRRITQPGIMLGTPAYMSPEALHGQKTDSRSDEFSFAVALYEALYDVRPYAGDTAPALAAEMSFHRVRPPPRGTKVPRRVHALILKALEPSPVDRFQTLRQLLDELSRNQSSRRRQAITVSVAVLATLALAIVVALSRRESQRCAGVAQRLGGVWDEPARLEGKAAFDASGKPWAPLAWAETEKVMNVYGARWVDRRRAACEASDGRADEVVGQRIVCLSRRFADFEATAQLLRKADPELVERAVSLAASLPPLTVCDAAPTTLAHPERDELRSGLASVKALIDAGKLKAAHAKLGEVTSEAQRLDANEALAEATWLSARLAAAEFDFARADGLAEDSILLAQQHQADEIAARAWVDRVGFAGAGSLDLADAERWARYARVAVNRVGAPRELEASLANNEAVLLVRQGKLEEARERHQKALGLREAVFGPESLLAARSHNNLGTVLRSMGRPIEAIAEFERALAIEEQVLAPEHPAVADTLNNLANALHDAGQSAKAVETMRRSLGIREQAYGAQSPKVAQSLSNLGAVLLDLQRPKEALEVLGRALAIKEKTAGPSAPTVAVTLTNLATGQRAVGELTAAIASDQRALEIRKATLGPGHPELARNLVGLGASQVALGNASAARALLEEALTVAGQTSVERGDADLLLARVLAKSDGPRCVTLLDDALKLWPATYSSRVDAEQLKKTCLATKKR